MAKEWNNRLAGLGDPRDPRADGLGLGDYMARYAGLVVPEGFPGSFAFTDARKQNVEKLAAAIEPEGAAFLAMLAARVIDEMFMWKSAFAHYAKGKDIELINTKAEMYQKLYEANTEFLEILHDPGTRAYLNASAKLARDPKQAAKAEAFKLWQDWQAGRSLHKSGAAFARFICEKYPVLESPTTVERWARKWAIEKAGK